MSLNSVFLLRLSPNIIETLLRPFFDTFFTFDLFLKKRLDFSFLTTFLQISDFTYFLHLLARNFFYIFFTSFLHLIFLHFFYICKFFVNVKKNVKLFSSHMKKNVGQNFLGFQIFQPKVRFLSSLDPQQKALTVMVRAYLF